VDRRERAELLKSWAREAGFDRAGVASLEPLERGEVFVRWLARGDHAGMDWLARRVGTRLTPAEVLPGARSALCVALRYAPPAGEEEAGPPAGDLWPRVARYARGRDYHNLMGKRLRKLARRVREAFPGCATRAYVDTGPVLERELAARAGLGVQGKNTCLLTREGSYFLLGELFSTLDLAPDAPLADLCGRCTRCLDACPTGALPEPYRLDANRCISYWTIEHRGAIPEAFRDRLAGWVFGCDVCQEVCPWNLRRDLPAGHPDFALPPERAGLDLTGLLALDEGSYRGRFRGSALQRARLGGLKRNAALAMASRGARGGRREPRYAEALARALGDGDPLVRRHAAWALGRVGGRRARAALRRALAAEADPEVAAEVRAALGRVASPASRSR
jgi:epoxyqueuosine reductase